MKKFSAKEIITPVISLFIICLVATALLALTNGVTAPLIEKIDLENEMKSRQTVLENAVKFEDTEIELDGVKYTYAVGLDESGKTVADTLAAESGSPDALDEDWRKAVLASAREHVLMHTALSDRDRQVYRAYAMEGEDIGEVAKKFGLSRNSVSQ
ncbi:MAG: hypothetical protein MJ177_05810, partial [Clostridia bacterium]|nr:hypothetical protein [Clostridia bacterium]